MSPPSHDAQTRRSTRHGIAYNGVRVILPRIVTDHCRQWIMNCIAAGYSVRVPAITYYETLLELERLKATSQIQRLKALCFSDTERFPVLETIHAQSAPIRSGCRLKAITSPVHSDHFAAGNRSLCRSKAISVPVESGACNTPNEHYFGRSLMALASLRRAIRSNPYSSTCFGSWLLQCIAPCFR